jgi:hypothetical protein
LPFSKKLSRLATSAACPPITVSRPGTSYQGPQRLCAALASVNSSVSMVGSPWVVAHEPSAFFDQR